MDCAAPVDEKPFVITVHEWVGHNNFRTHHLGQQSPIKFYRDDTLIRVITKIASLLHKDHLPYVWQKQKSILFTIRQTEWKGFNVNPWKARSDGSENVKPVIVYDFNECVGGSNDNIVLNIVFRDHCPYVNNEHYFPKIENPIPNVATIKKEDAILDKLWSYGPDDHAKLMRNTQSCIYSHVVFRGKPNKFPYDARFLNDLFDRHHATSFVPFIQWMDDANRILYKLYKKHDIPPLFLAHWTNMDRMPKVPSALTLYSPFGKRDLYARVFIALNGEVVVTYHMDAREKVDWDVVLKHRQKIFDFLKTFTGISYVIDESDITARTEIVSPDMRINELASFIGNVIPLFHVLKTQSGYLEAVYKRASNYKGAIQLHEFVQSKLTMGIPIPEIIEILVDMGVPQSEAVSSIETAQNVQEAVNAKKIETGTIIKINKISYGFKVHVVNCPSLFELRMLLHWLRACVLHTPSVIKKRPAAPAPVLTSAAIVDKAGPSTSRQPAKTPSPEDAESSVSESDLDFIGGAIGKEHQRYFLTMLQEADPDLFNNPNINYARTCQASSFHQPVVVTQEEHKNLIKDGFGEAIDNSITYGSDANKQNVYFCPRIWCPISRKPITYEMYQKNGNKCPSGEEAKLMYQHPYWNNSPDTKHFIGFHTKKTSSGLCLPCCYIKQLSKDKEKECLNPTYAKPSSAPVPASPHEPAAIPESYIMTQAAPLPEGRSGNIPQVLHEIITPNVTFQMCAKTLSSQECPVRRGVAHRDDSLMNAIAYAIGLSSKEELVKKIKSHLDPMTFLSLENGHIVAAFIDSSGAMIAREHAGLVSEMMKRLKKNPKYVETFGLKHIDKDPFRLSRELQLYVAWLDFLKYLGSNEEKSPHHLYDLLRSMGYLMVIWNREGANDVELRCPLYTSAADLVRTMDQHRKTIMMIYDNGYYEPIELKKRTNDGNPVIDTKYTSTIDDVLGGCANNVLDFNNTMFRRLVSLNRWAKYMLRNSSSFAFATAILAPDMRVTGILTNSNAMVVIPGAGLSIGYLPRLVKECDIKHVRYQEDVAGAVRTVRVLYSDMSRFARKLQSVGLSLSIGAIQPNTQDAAHVNAILTIKPPTTPPTILVRAPDETRVFEHAEARQEAKWAQLQRMIGKMFLQHYDTLVAPTVRHGVKRADRIRILSNTFPAFPDKKRLAIALEEMPLEYGKDALADWIRLIGYDYKYPFFQDGVRSDKGDWVFSQRAVEIGLPDTVGVPVKDNGARPTIAPSEAQKKPFSLNSAKSAMGTPDMLNATMVDKRKLPSKWTQIRSYDWSKFDVLYMKNGSYSEQSVQELIEWIAHMVKEPIVWGDVKLLKYKYVNDALMDKPSMLLILEDPSMTQQWAQQFGKSLRQPKQLWDRGFAQSDRQKLASAWDAIMNSGKLWPGDIDFFAAASLIDVSIIILHRSKYGAAVTRRGDIEDLVASSTLYTRKYDFNEIQKRPICIFYKDVEKERAIYSALTDQNGVFLFSSLFDCPTDIQKLVDHHLRAHLNK